MNFFLAQNCVVSGGMAHLSTKKINYNPWAARGGNLSIGLKTEKDPVIRKKYGCTTISATNLAFFYLVTLFNWFIPAVLHRNLNILNNYVTTTTHNLSRIHSN